MHAHAPPSAPRLEIATIFRAHGGSFRQKHRLSPEQDHVLRDLERCRTAALGGHLYRCQQCSAEVPLYNSCLNRHCPTCQGPAQLRWVEGRKERLLPTDYFHVVFTLPALLRPLARRYRRLLYDLLFATAAETLLTFGRDPKRLGAELGFTLVLHTWTRELRFHPHVHAIVTGGGLDVDADRWVSARQDYLFPVKALSRLFAASFCRLIALFEAGPSRPRLDSKSFRILTRRLARSHGSSTPRSPSAAPSRSSPTSASTPTASPSPTAACSRSPTPGHLPHPRGGKLRHRPARIHSPLPAARPPRAARQDSPLRAARPGQRQHSSATGRRATRRTAKRSAVIHRSQPRER